MFNCNSDPSDITEIQRKHSLLNLAVESCKVKIQRTITWTDSIKVGEAGVDDGGPRREYLQLMMAAMSEQSELLDSPTNRRLFQHNVLVAEKGHFCIMGCFIVLSLTQGGPAPAFFAPSVVDHFVGGSINVRPCVRDIPDYDVQEKLIKVMHKLHFTLNNVYI